MITKTPATACQPPTDTPALTAPRPRGPILEPDELRRTLDIMEALMRYDGVTLEEMAEISGWDTTTVRHYLDEIEKGWKAASGDPMLVEHRRDGRTIYRLE